MKLLTTFSPILGFVRSLLPSETTMRKQNSHPSQCPSWLEAAAVLAASTPDDDSGSQPHSSDWLARYGDLALKHAVNPDSLTDAELLELAQLELSGPDSDTVLAEFGKSVCDRQSRGATNGRRLKLVAKSEKGDPTLGDILGPPAGTKLLKDVVRIPAGAVVAADAWLFKVEGDTVLVHAPEGVTVSVHLDRDQLTLSPGSEEWLALDVLNRKTIEARLDEGQLVCVIR